MNTFLQEIIEYKKQSVAQRKLNVSIAELQKKVHFHRTNISLVERIKKNKKNAIIAEFKRCSPSKGMFLEDAVESESFISPYLKYGATGVSILTDKKYFHGRDEDITCVRHLDIPILRKDFIIDEYQIIESKAIGADVILFIATCLTKEQIKTFSTTAKNMGLEILFEIHSQEEVDKISSYIDMIGINNRNLQTFAVDKNHCKNLFFSLPANLLKVAESGIHKLEDIQTLKTIGFDAFLIGESLITASDSSALLQQFISA